MIIIIITLFYQILSYPDFILSRFYFIQILFHLEFISSNLILSSPDFILFRLWAWT